ncbi:hypothetical protein GGD81_000122 [Rhodobium orientis]|uniref:Glutamyl-tRNA amidotransferase n=1 Tax=Rhodobium orientis TaxID=34017 RepID=A0A327JX16_9HYPH|nr:GatB/YqeY domain-containing protein [Rhodobium orientis]MBB4301107.1 hypothetical protein [Rhodobium orientis]MBK5949774.1 glutamyl-tRNA amidotransferase [Rhodobium orientis]RAI30115.1 glutamyl-tRNA amidotransferase [Rhodobium orientis]
MREAIQAALKDAMKSQQKRRVATLRLISAAIKDRDIAARSQGKDAVGDDEILQILAKMVKQREESARIYEEAGRLELSEEEREEIEIISEFLPRQLSEEETRAVCAGVIAEIGASGLRDMGKTMSALKERYPGQMDFSKASGIVKEQLQ